MIALHAIKVIIWVFCVCSDQDKDAYVKVFRELMLDFDDIKGLRAIRTNPAADSCVQQAIREVLAVLNEHMNEDDTDGTSRRDKRKFNNSTSTMGPQVDDDEDSLARNEELDEDPNRARLTPRKLLRK
jgi:hypothetical protein